MEKNTSGPTNINRLPEAFLTEMRHMLGSGFDAFLASYEEEEIHALRLNTLKDGRDIKEIFELERVPWAENGYYYNSEAHPGRHPLHEAGAYYIQEASAMMPAGKLDVGPDMRVLDLCAAPGGKSTQLAEAMAGSGLLVSNEIIPKRAAVLSENIERMGIVNAIVTNESPDRLAAAFPQFFDRILVDAPCSGEGMFRKNPLAREEWSRENVRMCAERQRDILDRADIMLSDGGILVYSTCTFSKEEDEGTVEAFLDSHPWYRETERIKLFPHEIRGEGHFVSVLKKGGESAYPPVIRSASSKLPDAVQKELKGFIAENLYGTAVFESYTMFGEEICGLPKYVPSLKGLKVKRCGLDLGRVRQGRFIPSHSWAMALNAQKCRSVEVRNTDEAVSFIAGESLRHEAEKGWLVVTFMGYPLGWGKSDGNNIKNHYPKGLRKNLRGDYVTIQRLPIR